MREVYHLIGIGGVGMSGLARILVQQGKVVSGSDRKRSKVTKELESLGVKIFDSHDAANISKEMIVVYSTAIQKENQEYVRALELNNTMLHRSILLQQFLDEKKSLVVAGAHGKTSTTSLLAYTLESISPSYAVGGFSPSLQGNGYQGSGDYFVVEGDESDGSFLHCTPEGGILLNIDYDHLDFWKSKEALLKGYQEFLGKVKNHDLFFYWGEDGLISCNGRSYGFSPSCDVRGSSLRCEEGKMVFDVFFAGKKYNNITLNMIGEHNVLNALGVFGLAITLGVSEELIRRAFTSFKGIERRLQYKGEVGQALIYDDYAHHPKEVIASLEALKRAFPQKKIIPIFQPHRYSRFANHFDEFVEAFQSYEHLIVTDIFCAGEEPIGGVGIEKFLCFVKGEYVSRHDLVEIILSRVKEGDLVVTLGAGDITEVSSSLLKVRC